MDTIPQVAAAMQQVLTTTARDLGRSSGFVQRAGKLDGASFTQAWVFACMANPMPTWEDVSQSAATIGVAISPQGLEQRCTEAAATLLEEVLAAAVQQVITGEAVAIPLLARFTHVFVQDSSTIVLPTSLVERWKGCGGSTTTGDAALKLQVQLFKLWKSHGHVDESRGGQPWRVLCEVYAKLLAVVVGHWVMLTGLWAEPKRSLVKAAKLVQQHAMHLASSLWQRETLENALSVIQGGLQACCRINQRRAHPNTYQLLLNGELLTYVS